MDAVLFASTKISKTECSSVRKAGEYPLKKRIPKLRYVTERGAAAVWSSTAAAVERESAATGAPMDVTKNAQDHSRASVILYYYFSIINKLPQRFRD